MVTCECFKMDLAMWPLGKFLYQSDLVHIKTFQNYLFRIDLANVKPETFKFKHTMSVKKNISISAKYSTSI